LPEALSISLILTIQGCFIKINLALKSKRRKEAVVMIVISHFSKENMRYKSLLKRNAKGSSEVEETVRKIIEDVEKKGDEALFYYMKKFDGVELSAQNVRVSDAEYNSALASISPDFKKAAERACENIYRYHEKQKLSGYSVSYDDGVKLDYKYSPIDSVCITAPGKVAPLPSTAYMGIIPAKVAGVRQISLISTPKDGRVNEHILFIAKLLEIQNVYKISGAQGIAAMALGTESVEPVVKIAGPGNLYVQTAKKLLFGKIGIDGIQGPSELIIIWDDETPVRFVAADLLSQAEHGTGNEMTMVFVRSPEKAQALNQTVDKLIEEYKIERGQLKSLAEFGNIFTYDDLESVIDAVNELAPEHLEILSDNEEAIAGKIRNVGSVFMGSYSPEAVGDYFCGTNHILPTLGTARFISGLSVKDFMRSTSYIHYTKEALQRNQSAIQTLAETEGLFCHSLSVKVRN
jgi:histidinol dehydrogenase